VSVGCGILSAMNALAAVDISLMGVLIVLAIVALLIFIISYAGRWR